MPISPNGDLNLRIAASVLSCFPSDLLDNGQEFPWLWMARLWNNVADAQCLLDDLGEAEQQPRTSGAHLRQGFVAARAKVLFADSVTRA